MAHKNNVPIWNYRLFVIFSVSSTVLGFNGFDPLNLTYIYMYMHTYVLYIHYKTNSTLKNFSVVTTFVSRINDDVEGDSSNT